MRFRCLSFPGPRCTFPKLCGMGLGKEGFSLFEKKRSHAGQEIGRWCVHLVFVSHQDITFMSPGGASFSPHGWHRTSRSSAQGHHFFVTVDPGHHVWRPRGITCSPTVDPARTSRFSAQGHLFFVPRLTQDITFIGPWTSLFCLSAQGHHFRGAVNFSPTMTQAVTFAGPGASLFRHQGHHVCRPRDITSSPQLKSTF